MALNKYDKEVVSEFLSWLCGKYEVLTPEGDGYILYGDMEYHTKDELMTEYNEYREVKDKHILEVKRVLECFENHGITTSLDNNGIAYLVSQRNNNGVNVDTNCEDIVEMFTRRITLGGGVEPLGGLDFARGLAEARGEEFYYNYLSDLIDKYETMDFEREVRESEAAREEEYE